MQMGNLSISTDSPIAQEDGSLTLGDILTGEVYASPENVTRNAGLKSLVRDRLKLLKPLEREVISRRWGLDSEKLSTRKDLAAQLSVSVEWIRQIENTALEKLRADTVLQRADSDTQ